MCEALAESAPLLQELILTGNKLLTIFGLRVLAHRLVKVEDVGIRATGVKAKELCELLEQKEVWPKLRVKKKKIFILVL